MKTTTTLLLTLLTLLLVNCSDDSNSLTAESEPQKTENIFEALKQKTSRLDSLLEKYNLVGQDSIYNTAEDNRILYIEDKCMIPELEYDSLSLKSYYNADGTYTVSALKMISYTVNNRTSHTIRSAKRDNIHKDDKDEILHWLKNTWSTLGPVWKVKVLTKEEQEEADEH